MPYSNDLVPKDCTEPIRGRSDMVKNRGGGYGFSVDDHERLRRFLILGHEGGTYYVAQKELTLESVDCIDRLLAADPTGETVVTEIVDVSTNGRAPKNDPAIFALAYVASQKQYPDATKLAMDNLCRVCRIGTHLFDFLNICKTLGRGWGDQFKRGVGQFYNRSPYSLAKQVTKYAQRNGWSHRDVLRKCHYHHPSVNNVLKYVTQREKWEIDSQNKQLDGDEYLWAVQAMKADRISDTRKCDLIRKHNLPREVVPTSSLNNPAIWEALLENMPLTAMIRNLGKMTSVGIVKPMSKASKDVCEKLCDIDSLKAQRVHPVTILLALKTYSMGRGILGSLSWIPDPNVIAALDDAFYLAFDAVEPTGKRFMLGIDVSGSMGFYNCVGADILSCREAAAVMAMLTVRTEPVTYAFGFSRGFVHLGITARDSLPAVLGKISHIPFGPTNMSTTIQYALDRNIEADVFAVYTDNEVNRGAYVFRKLKEYRDKMNPNAKFASFAFTNTNTTVCDPTDAGMMDFVGFDASVPTLFNQFVGD